jgi:glycosyltransferase involved in cell wall biosynthesis
MQKDYDKLKFSLKISFLKSILIIVPFDRIYPPMNGGMQRCFHIMHQLARHFELTAIIHQDNKSFLQCVEEFPALAKAKIYSTTEVSIKDGFSLFPGKWENAFRSRWYQRELNRPADASLIKYYHILINLLKEKQFDAIILENSLNAVKVIRRYDKKVKIIYNAHNVDANLAKAAFNRKEITSKELKNCYDLESNLYKKVNAIFTCSNDDRDMLDQMNNGRLKIAVIPNGVNIPEKRYNVAVNEEIPQFLLFCGSLWSVPNAEGLYWFCKEIWPKILHQFPKLKLLVVGIGELPEKYSDTYSTTSTEFTGAVDDVKPYYNKAAVSIVPLLTGSGTRLKILEAMGMGVPVVSTTIGAEGIDYKDGKEILIADEENDFANKIIGLLKDMNKREKVSTEARKLAVSQYDWKVIGDKMAHFLNKEIA